MKRRVRFADSSQFEFDDKFLRSKYKQKHDDIWSNFLPTVIILMLITASILIAASYFNRGSNNLSIGLTGGAETVSRTELNEAIQGASSEINTFKNELDQLKLAVSEAEPGSSSVETERKLIGFNQRIELIEETVLETPTKAITASLLSERQKDMSSRMAQIEENQKRLNDRLDSFLSAAILVPAVSVVIAVVVAIVSPFTIRFLKRIGFYGEENTEPSVASHGDRHKEAG